MEEIHRSGPHGGRRAGHEIQWAGRIAGLEARVEEGLQVIAAEEAKALRGAAVPSRPSEPGPEHAHIAAEAESRPRGIEGIELVDAPRRGALDPIEGDHRRRAAEAEAGDADSPDGRAADVAVPLEIVLADVR